MSLKTETNDHYWGEQLFLNYNNNNVSDIRQRIVMAKDGQLCIDRLTNVFVFKQR